MVTFDHRDPGTSEDLWAASPALSRLAPLDLPGVDRLVVVAAHPDDESLGAAGLVARLAAGGATVSVIVATDGESSHPDSSTRRPQDLALQRRTELVHALGVIAPGAALRFLGLPDGGLREHRDALRRAVEDEVGSFGQSRTVLCAPWHGDGHRDHRIAGEVTAGVAARRRIDLLEYPVWLWHWGDPGDESLPWADMRRLELTEDEQAKKRQALAAHRSQTQALSSHPGDEALLGAEMMRHFDRAAEIFVVTGEQVATGTEQVLGAAELERTSLTEGFFDAFYEGKQDPWGFESRWYEERKRALTLASLPRPRFTSGLEVGCSTGVLTAELAARCDRLTGVDIAAAPLEAARARVGDTVTLLQLTTPRQWPQGQFDLVVLSEVGYYYGADDLDQVLDQVLSCLAPDGVLVACHWRHLVAEYPLSGDDVHAALAARPELALLARHEEEDFMLDVLVRPPATSVAARTGLL